MVPERADLDNELSKCSMSISKLCNCMGVLHRATPRDKRCCVSNNRTATDARWYCRFSQWTSLSAWKFYWTAALNLSIGRRWFMIFGIGDTSFSMLYYIPKNAWPALCNSQEACSLSKRRSSFTSGSGNGSDLPSREFHVFGCCLYTPGVLWMLSPVDSALIMKVKKSMNINQQAMNVSIMMIVSVFNR